MSRIGGRRRGEISCRLPRLNYSLGITLYELLTLQPAFEGKDRKEIIQKIIFAEPRPPRQISKAIPSNLETIVLKAIRKEPPEMLRHSRRDGGRLAAIPQR